MPGQMLERALSEASRRADGAQTALKVLKDGGGGGGGTLHPLSDPDTTTDALDMRDPSSGAAGTAGTAGTAATLLGSGMGGWVCDERHMFHMQADTSNTRHHSDGRVGRAEVCRHSLASAQQQTLAAAAAMHLAEALLSDSGGDDGAGDRGSEDRTYQQEVLQARQLSKAAATLRRDALPRLRSALECMDVVDGHLQARAAGFGNAEATAAAVAVTLPTRLSKGAGEGEVGGGIDRLGPLSVAVLCGADAGPRIRNPITSSSSSSSSSSHASVVSLCGRERLRALRMLGAAQAMLAVCSFRQSPLAPEVHTCTHTSNFQPKILF